MTHALLDRRAVLRSSTTALAALACPRRLLADDSRPIRIMGPAAMGDLIARLGSGFAKSHSAYPIEARLMGSDTAIPGLYAGLADIAIMGRPMNTMDNGGFGRVKGYMPLAVQIMNGSLATNDHSPAQAIIVHRDAPIDRISIEQISAIMRCDPSGKAGRWGDLGIVGPWADAPVRLYLQNVESGTGLFLLKTFLAGSHKVNWDRVRDYGEINEVVSLHQASDLVSAALSADRNGIAITNLSAMKPEMKAVPLVPSPGGEAIPPTRETVIAGTYPLARPVYAFVDRKPGESLDAAVATFLRYVLGPDGQAIVDDCGTYLPLNSTLREAEARRLS